jgi:TP901 family phage tail tape measure protein
VSFRTIEVALRANIAQFQAGMGAAGAQVRSFGTDVTKALSSADAKTQQAVQNVSRGALVLGGALVAGFGFAVKAGAGFEKQMSGVQAVSGATAGQMKLLGDAALKAGADTVFSASEAAQAQAELVKAGISVSDVLGGALTGALSLAAAGQLELKNAAEISAQAMNIFGLEGRDVSHIADVLAAGANKSAADVAGLGESLRQGGLVAAQTGLTLEETVGTLAAFADNALIGSDAGTSLKTMLQRLTPQTAEASQLMDQLGFSAYDAQGNFIGLQALAGEVQSSLSGMSVEQRNAAMATIFGSDAVRAANILYVEGAEGMRGYIDGVNDQGAALRMASELTDNLAGDLEQLKGSIETALIKSGGSATGVLRGMVQAGTEAVNVFGSLPAPVIAAGTALAGVGGSALLVLGGIGSLVPKLVEGQRQLASLGGAAASASRLLSGLGKVGAYGAGIGALAGAVSFLGVQIDKLMRGTPDIDEMTASLLDLAEGQGGIEAVGAAARGNQDDLRGFLDLISTGLRREMQGGEHGLKRALVDIDAGLTKLVEGGAPDRAAEALRRFAAAQDVRVEEILPYLDQYNGALKASETAARLSGAAAEEAGGAVSRFGGAQAGANAALQQGQVVTEAQKAENEALKASYEELGSSVSQFLDPMDAFNTVLQRNEESARKHAEEVAASTADAKDSWQDYATEATVSLNDFAAEQQKRIEAYDEFTDNLFRIAARGRADVARELAAMGPQGATLAGQFVTATDREFGRYANTLVEAAQKKPEEAGRNLDTGFKILAAIADLGSAATVQSVMNQLGPLPGLTEAIVRDTAERANVQLRDAEPAWNQSIRNRSDAAAREMAGMQVRVPPIVGATGDDMNRALADRLPAFSGTVNRYASTLEGGVRIVTGALTPFLANRGFGPITAAEGGVIDYYAAGGMKEKHVAQIARAGSWQVWAEPETGGEAYIPLAVAKRERSTNILEEVAGRFGLVVRPAAEDDVLDYHSGGLFTPPSHPQFPDFGRPIRPAGAGTAHNMREAAAEFARLHMQLPHHQEPVFAPGMVSGGKALARVQSMLGQFSGLRITSTYRSPARNAAVGGAKGSLHMDRNNPAVDIAGPWNMLNAFMGAARRAGGWREWLWQMPGHYDHGHLAKEGAIFNGFQSYDQGGMLQPGFTAAFNGTGQRYHEGGLVGRDWMRADERMGILQTGERVLSRAQTAAYDASRRVQQVTPVASIPPQGQASSSLTLSPRFDISLQISADVDRAAVRAGVAEALEGAMDEMRQMITAGVS